jgi:hypothetical protein
VIFDGRLDVRWTVVGFVGASTLALPMLASLRLDPYHRRAPRHFAVTSDADSGPGSLREGILAANRADGPAHIRLPPRRLTLKTSLPPIVNPHGVAIAGAPGSEIDGAALSAEPMLDLLAPGSRLQGLTVRNASGDGIRVHSPRVHLDTVGFVACGTGLRVLSGAHGVAVARSRFERNRVGLSIEGGAMQASVRSSEFRGHEQAAIWAVSAKPATQTDLSVRHCRFDHDNIGVVAWNVRAHLEDNDLWSARDAAIFISGRENVVQGNRVRGGQRYGICVVAADASTVSGNETDGNRAVGLLVRDTLNTVVRDNRVYGNGYGIVLLFGDARRPTTVLNNAVWNQAYDGLYVIGGSPVLTANELRVNRGAGVRIDDFVDRHGRERRSDPLLRDNALDRNGSDQPARGRYVERPPVEAHVVGS